MAFLLLKRLSLLFVLLGLALADKGVAPLEVVAMSMHIDHGEQVGRWTYHANSTFSDNATAAPPSSSFNTLPSKTDTRLFKTELTNLIMQEPGFVLLSLSFVFISWGMVFL